MAAPTFGATIYNNLTPTNQIGVATRPDAGAFEIEAGDDFFLGGATHITSASFVGLLVPGPTGGSTSIDALVAEIYRVFPKDSDTTRTPNVLTRVNSPSDVAFDSRDSAGGGLSFTSTILNGSFTVNNSVQPGGIHAFPNQKTGGDGPLTGQEVQIDVSFLTPFTLPSDHYFFIPQVALSGGAQFYWISASRPISGAGTTPFPAGVTDLQAWTRDAALDPDWSRVGTDIVGGTPAPTFNLAFSLDGTAAPEPGAFLLVFTGAAALIGLRLRRRTQ
ncbi:MAG: PEP-CTERM sorting domain-containing protein [Candidatus Solibacter sp.]